MMAGEVLWRRLVLFVVSNGSRHLARNTLNRSQFSSRWRRHPPALHLSTSCSRFGVASLGKPVKMPGLAQQYAAIKQKFPDYVVLFQVGDFYEIYNDDAIKVGEKTSLRVTRNPNVHSLMAGFPVRSLDSWLTTLIQQGFKLAICSQLPEKTPKTSRIMCREVVRLVTPGTLLEPLQPDANYLLSVHRGPGSSLGLAWLDLSTGDFHVGLSTLENLEEDLARINPAEVLIAEEDLEETDAEHNYKIGRSRKKSSLQCVKDYHLTMVPSNWFSIEKGENKKSPEKSAILNSAQFSTLESSAAAGLLTFVSYTQRTTAPLVNKPSKFSQQTHMAIDSNTRRCLELTKPLMGTDKKATLFGVMDNTATSAGRRLLFSRICAPSTDVSVIQKRLDVVEFFCSNRHITEELQKSLKSCPDIERKLQRLATGIAGLSDLRAIWNSMILYRKILEMLDSSHISGPKDAVEELFVKDVGSLDHLMGELDNAVGHLTSEYNVMEGYSNTADEIRAQIQENANKVTELKASYRESLGIPKLLINNHKAFIRVVEIPASQEHKLLDNSDFVRVDNTTLKIRYSTLKLQELNAELKALQEEHDVVQRAVSEDLCRQVTSHADNIKKLAISLAELDVASSLSLLALQRGYVKPDVVNGRAFSVTAGRHPVVDILQPDSFVANDCHLNDKDIWIVTGPNMGGKSTFLRQNAILAILAQAGSFIPAQSAQLGIVDRVFARIGASDNLVQHQSTFMSEMLETAYILTHATENSLVVIDEIGRGTSMFDGLSIAWAVVEYLHNAVGCRTLASTHYFLLARLAELLPRVGCYHVTAKNTDEGITFFFKVLHGCDQQSFGVEVAKLAGVPSSVEKRAREILKSLEQNGDPSGERTEQQRTSDEQRQTGMRGADLINPLRGCEGNNPPAEASSEVLRHQPASQDIVPESEVVKTLLSLNPEAITPKEALDMIFELHKKAKTEHR